MQVYHPKGYGLACDRCGKTFSYSGRSVFQSAYAAVAAAKEQGWKSLKSYAFRDLCPECRHARH